MIVGHILLKGIIMARLKAPQLRYERARHERNSKRYSFMWEHLSSFEMNLPNGSKFTYNKNNEISLDDAIDLAMSCVQKPNK